MRIVCSVAAPSLAVVLGLVVVSSARAEQRSKRDPRLTFVDDEPMSRAAATPPRPAAAAAAAPAAKAPKAAKAAPSRTPSDVGEVRQIAMAAPAPTPVVIGDAPTGSTERVAAAPTREEAPVVDNELVEELAARQMRRHQRALDACAAAATRRNPAAAGTLTLAFEIAERKVALVAVSDDKIQDPKLSACLVEAARRFQFSLATAHFRWPVTLAAH